MNRKIKIAQYGCGKMSVYLMRYVLEKGAELVAAFDMNPAVIGKDIGEIMGSDHVGIKVSDAKEADRILGEQKPDVCIIATRSTMIDVKDAFTVCAKNGVNAISTCEESLYPWNSSYQITKDLDALAKANNCTLCGSGYPDMYWGSLVTTLAGSIHHLKRIVGSSSYNVEDYGIALAEGHGAGLSVEEFEPERLALQSPRTAHCLPDAGVHPDHTRGGLEIQYPWHDDQSRIRHGHVRRCND